MQPFDTLPFAIASFVAAAALVWWAGTRLPRYVVALSERTGLGQGFAGMLVLGGITSLPEFATATSAAAIGAPLLALNNILGSASFNILLLALADMVLGKRPLTSVVARPATLIQGVLGMMLLATVIAAVTAGATSWSFPVGPWSSAIFLLCLLALRIADRAERRPIWLVVNPPDLELASEAERIDLDWRVIVSGLVGLAGLILLGGIMLAASGNAIARETGIASGVVGFIFVAAATSLPELSAIVGAMRSQRYELAVGEVFGSNLFNLGIIFVIDLVARGEPVLNLAGNFEALAALLALAMSGIFVLGLIERRDRTFLRMGEDSIAAIILYVAGTIYLLQLASP